MNIEAYYTAQTPFTDSEQYAASFADLSRDVAGLCRVVQGLIFHYREGEQHSYTVPQERVTEIDTRFVEKMLARILELDQRPLTEARPVEKRFIGCCRDCATLFCSMARYRGRTTLETGRSPDEYMAHSREPTLL